MIEEHLRMVNVSGGFDIFTNYLKDRFSPDFAFANRLVYCPRNNLQNNFKGFSPLSTCYRHAQETKFMFFSDKAICQWASPNLRRAAIFGMMVPERFDDRSYQAESQIAGHLPH